MTPAIETLVIGADHAGFLLKEAIAAHLRDRGIRVEDIGCFDENRVDYPDISAMLVRTMTKNGHARGVLCCGSGIGVGMAANRFPGIRAVTANDLFAAKMSRLHNDANVLCMGGRVVAPPLALEILDIWLETPFEGGRHGERVQKMDLLTTGGDLTTC